ncbi:MAG: hypothetical protein QOG09_266 [Solirubrobacterales bacterium]|jgi:hypothetical protein|nr:hypothetical protein [Solirubrobacterales bacterium]
MYPVTYEARYEPENRNRLTTFFRGFTALPGMLVGGLYVFASLFTAVFAWLALVFTGRYPKGLYDFHIKVLRIAGRVNGYYYLLTDVSPPLNGEPDPAYPIQIEVPPPKAEYSRVKALFRSIIAIPVYLLAYVWALIGAVCGLLGWFAIMFTGELPAGLADPILNAQRYSTRTMAYGLLLMTEDYPPFSEEDPGLPAELPVSEAAVPTEAPRQEA